jgi:hypothetical protein
MVDLNQSIPNTGYNQDYNMGEQGIDSSSTYDGGNYGALDYDAQLVEDMEVISADGAKLGKIKQLKADGFGGIAVF